MDRTVVLRRAGVTVALSASLALGTMTGPVSASTTTVASDGFSRTVAASWGSAGIGGPYSTFSKKSDYNVSGGTGTMRLPQAQATRRALLGAVSERDVDVSVRVKTSQLPMAGGSGQYAYLIVRHQLSGAEYRAKVRFAPTGGVYLGASWSNNGELPGETAVSPEVRAPGLVTAADAFFWLRVQVVGSAPTSLRLKTWRDGTIEPAAWQYTATNSRAGLQQPGSLGLMAYVGLPAASAPMTFSFDDLLATRVEISPSASDWPQFHHDASHSGNNTAESILSPTNVGGLTLAWRGDSHSLCCFNSSPAVVNGVVYVGAWSGPLWAFPVNCASGGALCNPLWQGTTDGIVDWSSPAVDGGVVYIGSTRLYAFPVGCASGGQPCSPLWTSIDVNTGYTSPTVADGVVYVGAIDGYEYAFAASCPGSSPCQPLWKGWTGGEVHSSAAVANGVVYVGGTGDLYAFKAGCATGGGICAPIWTGAIHATTSSAPAVVGGVVYIASDDGSLYAFAVGCASGGGTCAPLWHATIGGNVAYSGPAVAGGTVYVGSADHHVYAFAVGCNIGGGLCSPVWKGATGDTIAAGPAVANGVVYVASQDGHAYAFAVGCGTGGATCQPLWNYDTGSPINASPTVSKGVVYVASNTNLLYAFDLGGAAPGP